MIFNSYGTTAKVFKAYCFMMLLLTTSFALFICSIDIPSIVGEGINDPLIYEPVVFNDWLVTRDMWLAREHNNFEIDESVRLVVIHHTATTRCNNFFECAVLLRNFQNYYLSNLNIDMPYNFIIGNDGRVYEGRGWNKIGAHTFSYNSCSLGLAFIGDYRENISGSSKVTPLQEARAQMLFLEGIRLGYLHPNFSVLGATDLRPTVSPGQNLFRAIKNWPNYDHQNRFKNLTCKQIKELN